MIAKAVEAAAKGENIEQLLEMMLAMVPSTERDKIRRRFPAALKKRGMRQPASDADIGSHTAMERARNVFVLTAKQALARIMSLLRARPDIASKVEQAGKALTRHGVALDRRQMSEADIGTFGPSVGATQTTQDRGPGR